MRYAFLSDEWFTEVDKLIAAAGDLKIPPAMKDGLFTKGHDASYQTTLTVADDIARKIFVEGDAAAGVQAFLEGKISVEGDLATVVAMQTVEPSEQQMKLTRQIAAITQ
jgi:putative sterol carrier protein